jgi:hypothetical protein
VGYFRDVEIGLAQEESISEALSDRLYGTSNNLESYIQELKREFSLA